MSVIKLQLPTLDESGRKLWRDVSLATSLVAMAFVVSIAAMMLGTWLREKRQNPLAIGPLQAMEEQLNQRAEDERLKERIRQLDHQIRQFHFSRRAMTARGALLLIGGVAALLIAIKTAMELGKRPYIPTRGTETTAAFWKRTASVRRAVAAAALLSAGALAAVASMPRVQWPMPETVALDPGAPDAAPPTREMFLRNWPAFRGPLGTGVVPAATPVSEWDGASGKNILWKSEIALPGLNSPAVWEDVVFLCGADANAREVYCFSAADGKLRWKAPAGSAATPKPEVMADTGYAAASVCTDGLRVFALFATGELVCLDMRGKNVWSKSLGVPVNAYGASQSPLVWNDKLLVQFDQGGSAADGKSALWAFECATGKQLWKADRKVGASWASPIVIEPQSGPQIITAANPWVIAYNPADGSELWKAKVLSGDVAPMPVYADGMVFTCNDRAELAATKVDGRGDVTKTHVPWKMPDNMPDIVSPLAAKGLVFMVTTSGTITCVDAKSGEIVWDQAIKATFHASPALVGDLIYLTDTGGTTYIFKAGRQYELVTSAKLGDTVSASAAFAGTKLYLRGKKHLYCIGSKP